MKGIKSSPANLLRTLAAFIAGALAAIALAYVGAVLVLLASVGVPMGSSGGKATGGQYLSLLLIAGAAAAAGTYLATGIARHHSGAVVIGLAGFLAGSALWGFTSPGSQWPTWWAPALAAVLALGSWVGGVILRPLHHAPDPSP